MTKLTLTPEQLDQAAADSQVAVPMPEQIRQTRKPCEVHTNHIPATHLNEQHHVWPLGAQGPDIPANKVIVCATGHNNIHELLKVFIAMRGKVPYSELRRYSYKERELAKLGYERIQRRAM